MAKSKKVEEKKEQMALPELEVKKEINLDEIKKELKDYIDDEIKNVSKEELDRAYKKLIHEKNKKVIFRDVVIVIMLGIIGFLLFIMYKNDYFNKFFNKSDEVVEKNNNSDNNKSNNDNKEDNTTEEPKEEVKETKPTLEELKSKYGSLLNYYILNEKCIYKEDFYQGKLSSELRKYLVLNTIDFSSIKEEDDYKLINESTFKKIYDTLFNEGYEASTFDYDGNKIGYLSSLAIYMLPKDIVKNDTLVEREIIIIEEIEDEVAITTIEGVIRDNKLYNVISDEEIEDFAHNSLTNYQDKLNKITYVFKDGKLVNLK